MMDWNYVIYWTDDFIERYLDEHPRNDGDRALAREILETDIQASESAVRVYGE